VNSLFLKAFEMFESHGSLASFWRKFTCSLHCRNIRLNPPLTLPSLPDELLSIIFEALDFGANKKDFAALQATCKALQSALKVHPGNIELEGIWTTSHIEGRQQSLVKEGHN